MTEFFTSDLHFGHTNIITYCNRPYANAEEMDQALIENWNAQVKPDDHVWVLGDVVMGRIQETLPSVLLLNGTKHLVAGNHDRCWSGHKKVGTWPRRYEEVGFILEPNEFTMALGPYMVNVCHFPYDGDSQGKDRYSEHRPKDHGLALLHGHIHDKWQVNGRQINAGVDVHDYAPVSFDAMVEFVRQAA